MPEPEPALFADKVLYVGDANMDPTDFLLTKYAHVEARGEVWRRRGDELIEAYRFDVAEGLKGDPLDRSPPPELQAK